MFKKIKQPVTTRGTKISSKTLIYSYEHSRQPEKNYGTIITRKRLKTNV